MTFDFNRIGIMAICIVIGADIYSMLLHLNCCYFPMFRQHSDQHMHQSMTKLEWQQALISSKEDQRQLLKRCLEELEKLLL